MLVAGSFYQSHGVILSRCVVIALHNNYAFHMWICPVISLVYPVTVYVIEKAGASFIDMVRWD